MARSRGTGGNALPSRRRGRISTESGFTAERPARMRPGFCASTTSRRFRGGARRSTGIRPGEYAYYRRKASEIHPVAAPASRRTMKDPYDVLGVPKSASAKEIKAAFRRLAKKYHPD